MKITIIGTDYPEYEQYCPHWNGIKAGLTRLGIDYQFLSCRPSFEAPLFDAIRDFKPDIIVYGMLDMIKSRNIRLKIKEQNPEARIVAWYGDLRDLKTGQVEADCSELDAIFVSNDAQERFYKEKWKANAVFFLPLGAEPIKEPVYNKALAFPFVFVGGKITGKNFLDRALTIGSYEEKGLRVINSFEPELRKKVFQHMPAIYSSSKVVLDISHFTDIKGYTSIRYWEIPAFYGFALTKRFPGCTDFYTEEERVYFDTFDEAIEKRDFYLKNEAERMKILMKARERCYEHTYDKRFLRMFEYLGIIYKQ